MEAIKDLAITLKVVPYDERDRIITAITGNHGKVTVIAKNSIQSRRFGGALDLFTASEWSYSEKPGSDLGLLKEAQVRRSFDGVKKDFSRLSLGSFFAEIVMRIAPSSAPCPELFKLLANALAAVEEYEDPDWNLKILNLFIAKLLQWSGVQPALLNCLSCGYDLRMLAAQEGSRITALISEGGWICGNCHKDSHRHLNEPRKVELEPRSLIALALVLPVPLRKAIQEFQPTKDEMQTLFTYLEGLLYFHVPGLDQSPLKSAEFIGLKSNDSLLTNRFQ